MGDINCVNNGDGTRTCTCSLGVGDSCTITWIQRERYEWGVIAFAMVCLLIFVLAVGKVRK